MRPPTHIVVGMAAAGLVAGPSRPLALIAGAVAGVLPDLVDWWVRRVCFQPDVTITSDPLTIDPAILAQGVVSALRQAADRGCCRLRVNPVPAATGGYAICSIDYDRQHRLIATMAQATIHDTICRTPVGAALVAARGRRRATPLQWTYDAIYRARAEKTPLRYGAQATARPTLRSTSDSEGRASSPSGTARAQSIKCIQTASALLPCHPLPLRITDRPVDLHLRARGKRIESHDLADVTGIGHSLPLAGAWIACVTLCNGWIGLATAAALTTHLLVDLGGNLEIAPGWPFVAQTWHGRRLWDPHGWTANLSILLPAGGIIALLVLSGCK